MLNLGLDELLTTTRAVRKRLDFEREVPASLITDCLRIAVQAPMASNAQEARFIVVTDAGQKAELGALYASAFKDYHDVPGSVFDHAETAPADQRSGFARVGNSAQYLADNLSKVPAMLIPVMPGRFDLIPPPYGVVKQATAYASVFPAVWNFQLAARARELGTALTTVHLLREREVAEVLDIPYDRYTQCALLPIAFTLGTNFKPGPRLPIEEYVYEDDWGTPWTHT